MRLTKPNFSCALDGGCTVKQQFCSAVSPQLCSERRRKWGKEEDEIFQSESAVVVMIDFYRPRSLRASPFENARIATHMQYTNTHFMNFYQSSASSSLSLSLSLLHTQERVRKKQRLTFLSLSLSLFSLSSSRAQCCVSPFAARPPPRVRSAASRPPQPRCSRRWRMSARSATRCTR